jgi:signal peptidase I
MSWVSFLTWFLENESQLSNRSVQLAFPTGTNISNSQVFEYTMSFDKDLKVITRSQKLKHPSMFTRIQRTGLKSLVNGKDNAMVNGKNACVNSNKKIKIDRENGVGTVYDSEEGKRTVHCWQFNKTVNGLRLQNGVTAKGPKKTRFTDPKLGDNIAYFAIVKKFDTKKEADKFRNVEPERYDYIIGPRESYWVYDNTTSPASLINNNPSGNNCSIANISNAKSWVLWVKASKNIRSGGHLSCAYGLYNEHHNKRRWATEDIAAQQKQKANNPAGIMLNKARKDKKADRKRRGMALTKTRIAKEKQASK